MALFQCESAAKKSSLVELMDAVKTVDLTRTNQWLNHIETGELPELLTIKMTANYLGVNVETVRRWIREGKLGGIKIGAVYRVKKQALLEFVAEGNNHDN